MTTLRLKIADHPIELRFPSRKLLQASADRYGEFLCDEAPRTRFCIRFSHRLRSTADTGEAQAILEGRSIRYWRGDLVAEADEILQEVRLEMRDAILTMDAALRIFYSILLIKTGGLLLHSAAAGLEGKGLLFIGKTESGKSDLSGIAQGDHLTDELSPVRAGVNGFVVYGSPFWGLFGKGGVNVGLPIEAAFFLSRNEETTIEHATKGALLKTLLRCVVNFSKESSVADRVVQTGLSFLETVPSARLLTPPSSDLWEHVRRFVDDHS